MRKGVKSYFAASLTSQVAALVRYVVLARMLGPEELGYAAMLILTAQFFEQVSDTGGNRFLVQDADGDSPVMQRFVQLVMSGRGLLIALAMVATAPLLAALYNAPQITPALMAMGAVSLITGFMHMDLYRAQRGGDFRPEGLALILGELSGLAGTAIAALITHDHTAVVYGLVAKSLVMVAVAHITASRKYQWGYSRAEGRRFSKFALPLAVNGLMLFVGSQGDRLLVGSHLGAVALGQYSAIMLLIYYPSSIMQNFLMNMHMPQVAAARDDPPAFRRLTDHLGGRVFLLAIAMSAGFTLVGPFVAPILYGPRFAQTAEVFALLAVLQTARFLRVWPTTIAIATGQSAIVMWNNTARMIALPAAIGANMIWPGLPTILGVFILGELLALSVALGLLARARTIGIGEEIRRAVNFVLLSLAILGWAWLWRDRNIGAMPVLAAVTVGLGVLAWRRERGAITQAITFARDKITSRRGA